MSINIEARRQLFYEITQIMVMMDVRKKVVLSLFPDDGMNDIEIY